MYSWQVDLFLMSFASLVFEAREEIIVVKRPDLEPDYLDSLLCDIFFIEE